MYYEITSFEILVGGEHEKPTIECVIKLDNGDVRVLTIDLKDNRSRAIEQVLRHDIDALLNAEK